MRRFNHQLAANEVLSLDFSGEEQAGIFVEVHSGQLRLTTRIFGRSEVSVLPAGRSWSSGTLLRRHIQTVRIERDPDGPSEQPVISYDIGPEAGHPGTLSETPVARGTRTDRSGNVASGGTSEQMMAANPARRFLLVQNIHATEDLWIRPGASDAAVDGEGSIQIEPGLAYVEDGSSIGTEAWQVIATTTGHKWTAYEG